MKITLYRRGGKPPWVFERDQDGDYVHFEKTNIYRLFFDFEGEIIKPVWVGRMIETINGVSWITVEREIRADYIEFIGTKIIFT